MQIHISNTHNAHGFVFTLNLGIENEQDREVIEFLKNQFEAGRIGNGRFAFYVRKIKQIDVGLAITFSENAIHMAKVDYRWNPTRTDLKLPVLLLDERDEEYGHGVVPHFPCHWCKNDVYGIDREAIEVYDPQLKEMKLVQVHSKCQEIREQQISEIPFVDS